MEATDGSGTNDDDDDNAEAMEGQEKEEEEGGKGQNGDDDEEDDQEEEEEEDDDEDEDEDNMEDEIEEIRERAKVANKERMEDLCETIGKTFSYLRVENGISADGRDFIGVARKSLSGSRIPFIPTFHIAITKLEEENEVEEVEAAANAFTADLMLHTGKVVQTETIRYALLR
jgi:poly(A) polymerase Pap1